MFKFSKVEISVIFAAVILFIGALWGVLNQSFLKNKKNTALILGHIVEFSNEFQTKEKESFYWSEGLKFQTLHRGDSIYVNPGSKVKIKLVTNDEIVLNENTLITLDQTNESLDISLKTGVINSPLLTASIKIDFCGKNQSVGLKEASEVNLQKRTDCKYQISVKDGDVKVGQKKVPKKFEIESNYLFKNNTMKVKNETDETVEVQKLSDNDFEVASEGTPVITTTDNLNPTPDPIPPTAIEKALSSLENIVSDTTDKITETTEQVIDKIHETLPDSVAEKLAAVTESPAEQQASAPVEKPKKKKSKKKEPPPPPPVEEPVTPAKKEPPPEPPFVALPIQFKKNFYTQTGENSHFTILWKGSRALRDGEKYQIEISTDRTFESEVIQYESKETFLKIKFTLKRNDYYWRVRLKSPTNNTDWSPTAQFSIK